MTTARALTTSGDVVVLVEAVETAAGEVVFVDRLGKRWRPDQLVRWSPIEPR